MQSGADNLWLVVATFLVLLMQCGFLLLEGGRVRSKNSINVAQKNITDLAVVWASFFTIGFFIMFGITVPDLVSGDASAHASPLDFVYQFAFACTSATIVSGAIVERVSFRAYLVLVAVMTTLFYPLIGRLVWGNTFDADLWAPLAELGFIDFAGSTVVHGTGAWFGLVSLLLIGPRIGRFDENGKPRVIAAHNAVIALCGVLILMLGWIGFNGGSVSPSNPLLEIIVFNTLTAGAFGAIAGMSVGVRLDKGIFNPDRVTTGLLGGLVACTAGVHLMSAMDAIYVGVLGGFAATWGSYILLHRFRLDDPLEVVATHGIAGVLGTLSVAFVAPESALVAGSRAMQFMIQLAGVVTVFLVASSGCWVTVLLIRRFMCYRVSEQAEQLGLNYTEHGESVGLNRLQQALESHTTSGGSFATDILETADDEQSELVMTLNKVIRKYETVNNEVIAANVRFQQFAETATDWLWESDTDLKLTFVHASSQEGEAGIAEAILGRGLFEVLETDKTTYSLLASLFSQRAETPVFEAVLRPYTNKDSSFAVEMRGVAYFNAAGEYCGYRGTITDISIRKAAESRAIFLSLHDELTGLPNRRALSGELVGFIEPMRLTKKAVVVACVDLDGFKAVNDAYGHHIGDALLRHAADRLERFLRPTDRAYRVGGDEFVIVLTDLDARSVGKISQAIMQRLIEELSKIYYVQTLDLSIGASVGISIFPEHDESFEGLLRKADLALYAAKDRGKGCAVIFEPSLDNDAKLQLKIESDLHKALEEKEFYLNYQPQVAAGSGEVLGFEALIRWLHPERGEIPPGDFISVAEKMNLMERIGTYVLECACEFAMTWPLSASGQPLKIAVNVSPQQFRSGTFCATVRRVLMETKLPAERLELEITEDVLVHDFLAVAAVLGELRDMGVCVAVDDFGSGQTSLRYLNQFPLTTIKIDRSFIRQVANDSKAAEITQTIVDLGHRLGVNVLAEGVEDADQLALLQEWSCDQIQGFLFSRPMSTKDVTDSLDLKNSEWKKAS